MDKTESIEKSVKLKNMKVFFVLHLLLVFLVSCLFFSCNNGSEKIVYAPAPVPNNGETVTSGGGETQSGVITSVTEATIVDEIKKMTESGTVKASGLFDSKLIEDVKNAINYLADERPNVFVTLDLSAVKGLSKFSFQNCVNLAGIVLPNDKTNMTSIGNNAFRGCTGLTSVTIPGSVTSIGDDAFYGCTSLASCNYTGTLAQWCNLSFGTFYANPCYYAKKLCIQGQEIKDLVIPDGVTNIGMFVFCGCAGFTSVTIPNGVISIGSFAFSGCTGLTSVIPNSVIWNSAFAFSGCTGLTSVTIPSGVTIIEQHAFDGCTGLTSVTIPSGVTSIGNDAFRGCTGLTSVTIPGSVTSIGDDAFIGCTSLASCNYTGPLAQWCNIAFWSPDSNPGCYAKKLCIQGQEMKDLVIPDGVNSIGKCAFFGFAGLTSVTIPSGVTIIEEHAFDGCAGLTSVTIPSSVAIIGQYAFGGCKNLANAFFSDVIGWQVYLGNSRTSIDSTSLADSATAALYLRNTYTVSNWYNTN